MALIIFAILLFILHVVFEIPGYAIILAVIGFFALLVAIILIENKIQEEIADKIKTAKLIKEVAVYKKKAENTGFSVTWEGRRDHYTYVDALDHYKCTFLVKYKDGTQKSITCKKDSTLYSRLIMKSEK